jgi:hypothetical protein
MISVICIDDSNRPNEVPITRWLELHQEYTIIKVMIMKVQGGLAGVKLEEINNDDLFPWTYFRADRFGQTEEQLMEYIKNKELEVEYV